MNTEKSNRPAISLTGQKAEQRFISLVPNSKKTDKAKKGDVIFTVDGIDSYVEIKECHAAKLGTINQVRAIKYICCVIWAPKRGYWYVISPDQLVELASKKPRGQHTEIAFESMNFGLAGIPEHLHTKCSDEDLGKVVQNAIRQGRKRTDLAAAMETMLVDIQSLKKYYINQVFNMAPQGELYE